MLYKANAYSWTGQILARDRGITGLPIADTNTAQDWDNSFARTALGRDVTHRVERPGQSFWRFPALQNIPVEMIVTSAPENNFSAMVKVYEKARSELLINIYQWTSPELAKPVVAAAKRGVKVHVLMDGSPVGGVDDRSRHIARKLTRAGVRVYWMRGERKQRIHRRYRFNHAKYVIADRQWVVIGSENYGSTGHPIDPSYGNRGWEIQIRSQAFANQLRQVFMEDTDIKRFRDLVAYREESGFRWGPPQKTKPPKAAPQKGTYTYRRSPLYIRDRADLQLVLSPDNSLNEKDSLIGAILGCRQEVLVIQNSIPLYWGQKDRRSFEKTPNLALQAVIQAARKGCKVRVLIDSVWYNIQADNPRDNDDTVRMLNLIAHREQIDLQAKLVNLEAAGLSKIHTKGVIVDRRTTFIGSINWSENSFKGNREVGVIVTHPKVAMYYTDLFMRDWIRSRIFRVSITKHQAPVFIKPNALSKILRVYSVGDPVDVLAEVGDFYQVRLHERLIGYLRKSKHTHIFNSYEARFQIGRYGVVIGRIYKMHQQKKLLNFQFSRYYRGGLSMVIWRNREKEFIAKFGELRSALPGRYVQIKGRITSYRGTPQIIARNPNDISILH
jgi:phosphatidylserine/phosphatidylglycerophosphate/cardiolipin synthase-like enzyme